jgi:ATP-binding cassette subfamily B protein
VGRPHRAERQLSAGDVMIFVAAVAGAQSALSSMANDVSKAHYALLMFDHYEAVTTASPDLLAGSRVLPPLRRGIEFRGYRWSFRTGGRWRWRGATERVSRRW